MKQKINIGNYEAWLLDYIEGNLDIEEEEMLFGFLKANRELCNQVEDITPYTLKAPEKSMFRNKSKLLKKDDNDDILIAASENELKADEASDLQLMLKEKPELANEISLYQQCTLKPDGSVYQHKNKLRKATISINRPMILSAAAVVLLLITATVAVRMFADIASSDYNAKPMLSALQVSEVRISSPVSYTTELFAEPVNYHYQSQASVQHTNTSYETNRIDIASLPAQHIQRINIQTEPVELKYYETALPQIADYNKQTDNRFSFRNFRNINSDNISLARLNEIKDNIEIGSPVKWLRKTKEDLFSQDLIAEIRNFKN